jgi:hypothetical protein
MITPEVISEGAHDGIEMGTPGATAAARRRFGIDGGGDYECGRKPLLLPTRSSDLDPCSAQRRMLHSQLIAALKDTPGIPGLDIPGLDIVSNMLRSSMCFQFSAR